MRRLLGKWFDVLHLLEHGNPANNCSALENPEPLQVLKRHVEDRDTACHRLPQHLNPQPLPLPWVNLVCNLLAGCFLIVLALRVGIDSGWIVDTDDVYVHVCSAGLQALQILIRHR
jgi:hypothetical protein